MKWFPYLPALIILFSCNQRSPKQPGSSKERKFKKLLGRYKSISFDTLEIYSSDNLESSTYKFKGTHLDSADVSLFPKPLSEQYGNDTGFYACYKFSIDSGKIGLITRIPSIYESSSIKLLILDRQQALITDFIELAETVGDAGDMMTKTSWIFKGLDKRYRSLLWMEEGHDNSVDNPKDTTVERHDHYYLFDISASRVDSIPKNEKEILNTYGRLIFRVPGRSAHETTVSTEKTPVHTR